MDDLSGVFLFLLFQVFFPPTVDGDIKAIGLNQLVKRIRVDGADFLSHYFRNFKQKENMVPKSRNVVLHS